MAQFKKFKWPVSSTCQSLISTKHQVFCVYLDRIIKIYLRVIATFFFIVARKKVKRKKQKVGGCLGKSAVSPTVKAVRGWSLTRLNVAALFSRGLCVFRGQCRRRAFAWRNEYPYSMVHAFTVPHSSVLNSASGISNRTPGPAASREAERETQRGNRLLISLYKRERSRARREGITNGPRSYQLHSFLLPLLPVDLLSSMNRTRVTVRRRNAPTKLLIRVYLWRACATVTRHDLPVEVFVLPDDRILSNQTIRMNFLVAPVEENLYGNTFVVYCFVHWSLCISSALSGSF